MEKIKFLASSDEDGKFFVHEPDGRITAKEKYAGEYYYKADVDALLSDVTKLVEAAKPFAKLLQKHNDNGHPTKPIFAINDAMLTLGDLRKINKAIAAVERHLQK